MRRSAAARVVAATANPRFRCSMDGAAPRNDQMTDDTLWWLARPGEQPTGPYPLDDIRRRVEETPGDWQVCPDGEETWRPWQDAMNGRGPAAGARTTPPSAPPPNWTFTPSTSGVAPEAERGYLVIMHVSQFAGYLIPLAGIVVPLVLWLMKREDPEIDRHGREIMNWIIFELIAVVICILLTFLIIGIPLLIVLGIAAIVFPILGAVQASSGGFFKYPMLFRVL